MERLERRVGDVLYQKQKWFKWVRQCQDEEEAARENEKKKVKKEAALFKRHVQDVQSRMRKLRAKEDLKRQEAYLDEAYKARLSEEQEAEWDPIEDVIEDERGNYVDLIKHILLMTEAVHDSEIIEKSVAVPDVAVEGESNNSAANTKTSKKSRKSKTKGLANSETTQLPDKSAHDTASQVRQRLKEGVPLKYGNGVHVAGTIENPVEIHDITAPFPDDEIDQLLNDMAEIKHLLFCRLLLSHAASLPAAMKANSIDEFLNDKDVTDTDLRDLTLKIDNPGLQEIRDACADLGRGDEDDDEEDEEAEEEPEVDRSLQQYKRLGLSEPPPPQHGLPRHWALEREKRNTKEKGQHQEFEEEESSHIENPEKEAGKPMIDFGELDDQGKFRSKKMRVKVCGRYIYNYPSERAISRGGWLQFCLIAKNSDLHDAIRLCRHWDDFLVLNVLSMYQYFPAANWLVWKGDRLRQ